MLSALRGYRYVYRVAYRRYAQDLTGEGVRRFGCRWTPPGYPVLYTAEHPALAGFEKLVHAGVAVTASPLAYRVVVLSISDDSIDRVEHVPDDLRAIGIAWLTTGEHLALAMPSAVVPYASNMLIKPRHPLAQKVVIEAEAAFAFDTRVRQQGPIS